MTTLGLPPNFSLFASISPTVHETLNLPGKTLTGPRIDSTLVVPSGILVSIADQVQYTYPPFEVILSCSVGLSGQWSSERGTICLPPFLLNNAQESPIFPT
jgi:hypothetical protein